MVDYKKHGKDKFSVLERFVFLRTHIYPLSFPQPSSTAFHVTWLISAPLQGVCWWCLWLNSLLKFTTQRSRPQWRDCAATCLVNTERLTWLWVCVFFSFMSHHEWVYTLHVLTEENLIVLFLWVDILMDLIEIKRKTQKNTRGIFFPLTFIFSHGRMRLLWTFRE